MSGADGVLLVGLWHVNSADISLMYVLGNDEKDCF